MYFYATLLALTALTVGVTGLPPRRATARSDITGAGGDALGGSVNGGTRNCTEFLPLACGLSILEIESNNAGAGGQATSGSTQSHSIQRVGPQGYGSAKFGFKGKPSENQSSGMGGSASGGSVNNAPDGLIELDSNNAGNGGEGTSGSIF